MNNQLFLSCLSDPCTIHCAKRSWHSYHISCLLIASLGVFVVLSSSVWYSMFWLHMSRINSHQRLWVYAVLDIRAVESQNVGASDSSPFGVSLCSHNSASGIWVLSTSGSASTAIKELYSRLHNIFWILPQTDTTMGDKRLENGKGRTDYAGPDAEGLWFPSPLLCGPEVKMSAQ